MLFSGDSLLRNIFIAMCSFSWGDPIDCSGIMHHSKDYSTPNRSLYFQWAPSVFYQQPTQLIHRHTCAVMHMGVWDMGTYYRGEQTWKNQLTQNVRAWKHYSGNTKLFWLRLHKLYPDRDSCKREPKCFLSNTREREQIFRQISDKIMS